MAFKFPKWIPIGARARLQEFEVDKSATNDRRALVKRLSTHPSMQAVWERLSEQPEGVQTVIIDWIIFAHARASGLKPPRPKSSKDLRKYLEHHRIVETSAELISVQLRNAISDMSELKQIALNNWPSLWDSEPRLSYDQLVSFLTAGADFYDRLHAQSSADAQEFAAEFQIPPLPRKLGSATAKQTYFSRILGNWFERQFGSPMDVLVATVTDVVFDLRGEISSETARGRRRSRVARAKK